MSGEESPANKKYAPIPSAIMIIAIIIHVAVEAFWFFILNACSVLAAVWAFVVFKIYTIPAISFN